jgi:hypothetical protein
LVKANTSVKCRRAGTEIVRSVLEDHDQVMTGYELGNRATFRLRQLVAGGGPTISRRVTAAG